MEISATLVLKDGTIFYGKSVGIQGETYGEIVFNTSMTGYQEILTDPSYSNQIITFTYPHIGNVGINKNDCESNVIHAKGLIVRDISSIYSNHRSQMSLLNYLLNQKIIVISNIDTRKLTRILRTTGSQYGYITTKKIHSIINVLKHINILDNPITNKDLVKQVSTKKFYIWKKNVNKQKNNNITNAKLKEKIWHVVVYDFGVKKNILNMLTHRNCYLTVIPADTSAEKVLQILPDGIFLSNGPGDPRSCTYALNAINAFLKINIPIFGICLGHQLLALASGAKIIKMKFGHHGSNHPVKELKSNTVMITSQNHNYTVDTNNLPKNINITHISLFDGSIQGLQRNDKHAFSFQGHPEASPGPHDSMILFDKFIKLMKKSYNSQQKTII
ncbi:glutamine-hydrolyzing carbamoyl-phosphate synthase small subunit [Buchnera aphidicola]|uniref:glutamine-hydrolyzing carbamoyl-phosphate synthase small subunit n=1 Tax=Buchnera aphidicola TaxID=9 RepID=UPI000315E7D5|nr:glutamine-hydrolyzing carbamoyl-phosphate synthase small subunit [Buchnera aphidicola]